MTKIVSFPHSAWALCFAIGALSALSLDANGRQPVPKKVPVPSKQALDRARALIEELFRDELAKAKDDRDVRLKLAQTFFFEAKDTNDDAAGKFDLLQLSAHLAGLSGESGLVIQAMDEMSAQFDMPPSSALGMKIAMLGECAMATAPPEAYQGTFDAVRSFQEEAIAIDDYDNALVLGNIAEAAAKKLKSVSLVSASRKRNAEVNALAIDYGKVLPSIEILKKDPKNPKANEAVGVYYALIRGQWDKGLSHLAQCQDEEASKVAKLDLANKDNWSDCQQTGALWFKLAARFENVENSAKINILLRAYHWHQRAFADPAITEKGRKEIEAAMLAVNEQLPPELRAGEIAVELRRFTGHNGPVFGVAISGDGSKVVSGGADGVVRLWESKSGKQLQRFDGHSGPVWAVAISLDGRQIVSGGFDKTVRVLNKDQYTHDDYVRAVALSADGKVILSGGDDRMIKWSGPGFGALQQASGHDHFVFGVAISRDGKRGLSASLDRTVRLWDLDKRQTLKVLSGHTDTVLAVTFMPDQQRALSASTDKTLRLWDLNTGQTLKVFKGHTGYVHSVAVSPDGRRALSAGQDGKVIVWDVDTGKMLRVLSGHSGQVWSVAFSGDGRWAVTSGDDGTVRLWGNAK